MKLTWIRQPNGDHRSADDTYQIKWKYYGKTGKTWFVSYRGRELPLGFHSRLKDAKAYAQEHADKAKS